MAERYSTYKHTHERKISPEEAKVIERRRRIAWLGVGVLFAIALGVIVIPYLPRNGSDANAAEFRLQDIPFNGERAYGYLKQLTDLGPRPSGSEAMTRQQKLIVDHFEKLGATVELQKFTSPDPRDGKPVPMANIVVRWNPASKQRILLCSHYDTLPFPMRDKQNPQGRFVGANDGASSTALLMELGNEMKNLSLKYGVDFVFFDAEEYIFREGDKMFLGSKHFARKYKDSPPGYRYVYAVVLDMIGDSDLRIFQERNSMWWRDTRPLVEQIWATARRLKVKEFIRRQKYFMDDDHIPLHEIAGIPACNVIDFDYPAWHTEGDTADKCSALSLAKVGWVIREWLETAK